MNAGEGEGHGNPWSDQWRHWGATVTSGNTLSTSDQVVLLTRKDLVGFDKIATELILEMQTEGWRGFVTNRGHAAMRHPDGSHQSLTRSSNRAKSGTAMRARYESWKRRRAEKQEAVAGAFGVIPDPPADMPVPVVTLLEMRKHPVVGEYIVSAPSTRGDEWQVIGYSDDPRAWSVFNTAPAYPVLIGYGSATDETGAWGALMQELPTLFPEPDPQPQGPVGESDQEDVMASVFVCPELGCGKQFSDQRRASVHNASAHHREVVSCDVPGCGWVGEKHTLSRHIDKMHDSTVYPCPWCGREYNTSAGFSMHRVRKHKDQPLPEVTVTHMDTTGAPPPHLEPTPPVTSGDATVVSHANEVLMDHLEHLPEGADAEQMIAAVRSVVAGPLVTELRRLREELVLVTNERDKFRQEAADFEARLTLMREVMGV